MTAACVQVNGLRCELSRTQLELVRLTANGLRNGDLVRTLGLSHSVVQAQLRLAMDATGTSTRTALAAFCIRHGLIT